jgi:RNA-splicing ligase RtcB
MITGNTLIEYGWKPGPYFKEVLDVANQYSSQYPWKSIPELMSDIEYMKPEPIEKMKMREQPIHLAEAITSQTDIERTNLESVRRCMADLQKLPNVKGAAIMPDACPAGSGITVGGAVVLKDAICPAMTSADICCSMYATFFKADELNVKTALDTLTDVTRFGPGGRHPSEYVHHPVLDERVWSNPFLNGLQDFAAKHMCDQGDGNHFAYLGHIEISEFMSKELWSIYRDLAPGKYYVLVTHHGSRGLGAQVYKRGIKAAEKHTNAVAENIPKHGHWLDYNTDEGQDYWDALQYVSRWTHANHQIIHARFIERLQKEQNISYPSLQFGNEHNFVWKRISADGETLFYQGKGATPAWNDQRGNPLLGLIPLNMSSPILVVLGGDNEEFMSFAPHGAGRNESRTALHRRYQNKDSSKNEDAITDSINETTEGVDVRWYSGEPDLSETPIGYKNADQIIQQIQDFKLADVIGLIQPLGCLMAGHIEPHWKKKK